MAGMARLTDCQKVIGGNMKKYQEMTRQEKLVYNQNMVEKYKRLYYSVHPDSREAFDYAQTHNYHVHELALLSEASLNNES